MNEPKDVCFLSFHRHTEKQIKYIEEFWNFRILQIENNFTNLCGSDGVIKKGNRRSEFSKQKDEKLKSQSC
jgi:hypothetical protein